MRVVDVRRARGWFWGLTVVAILAAGAFTQALTLDPGPAAGLQLAGSGLVLASSATLATRVLLALTGAGCERAHGSVQERLSQVAPAQESRAGDGADLAATTDSRGRPGRAASPS